MTLLYLEDNWVSVIKRNFQDKHQQVIEAFDYEFIHIKPAIRVMSMVFVMLGHIQTICTLKEDWRPASICLRDTEKQMKAMIDDLDD